MVRVSVLAHTQWLPLEAAVFLAVDPKGTNSLPALVSQEMLEDLMLRLQLVRREKRGLELREAALRAQGPAHVLLLEQLRWERAQLRTGGANSSGGDSSGGGSSGDEEAWSQVSDSAWTW